MVIDSVPILQIIFKKLIYNYYENVCHVTKMLNIEKCMCWTVKYRKLFWTRECFQLFHFFWNNM